MAELLIDVEIGIPKDRFFKFKELAELWDKSVPETIEICMYEKCDEYLDTFKENIPNEEKTIGVTTGETKKRPEEKTVVDTSVQGRLFP